MTKNNNLTTHPSADQIHAIPIDNINVKAIHTIVRRFIFVTIDKNGQDSILLEPSDPSHIVSLFAT